MSLNILFASVLSNRIGPSTKPFSAGAGPAFPPPLLSKGIVHAAVRDPLVSRRRQSVQTAAQREDGPGYVMFR